ncbi:FecCD family ABC transporter permease [Bordetella holmesii]|uniref:Iron chelate uptake ABC transporter, FeCT family, permease protein n=1 Tax=Bordetella holmesii CDC-H585-BH TaxID=1331206 RepID=A0A158M7S3_9BORD|nr:iron ABC transporter permease [Bordetella holmesii]AMD45388.1 iron ABC transporter [Bordetella holmesii H558]AMD49184.1 ABC transporter permease [Bordetella holmesii F627]AOB34277.1 iron ABC transporter [Bordetella holmesii]AUL18294.1 iron ABC transporter [Bordetella holmesii]AUL21608.1 iron ABC transporter [Bordetella holmesii]
MAQATEAARARWIFAGLASALVVVALLATASGAVSIPLSALPRLLTGRGGADDALWQNIIWDIRLPRVAFALVAGAALAICGATMQALFRNPLAEPGLVGISLGGALGAVAAIVLGAGGFFLTASAAFAGSLAATACAYVLGQRVQGVSGLLLAGIAINAICGAVLGLLTFIASDAQLRDLTFWNMGSLAGARWSILAFLAPWTLFWCVWLMRQWRALNALLLGEREAQHLGFALSRLRRKLILVTALVVGPLVAATGGIGFVGLVVPHLVRMGLGANHRLLLPACILAGAVALALADWLARIVVVPAELPIGLVTALVGGPFFLWLLARGRRF